MWEILFWDIRICGLPAFLELTVQPCPVYRPGCRAREKVSVIFIKKLAHLIVTSAERKHVIRHNNKPLFFLFGIRNKYFTRLKIDIPPVQLPSLLWA